VSEVTPIGLDIAKNVFHAHDADARGVMVFSGKLLEQATISLSVLQGALIAHAYAFCSCRFMKRRIALRAKYPLARHDLIDAGWQSPIFKLPTTMAFVPSISRDLDRDGE
jgi:hypothetical protein